MPTIITAPLRELTTSELETLAAEIDRKMKEIEHIGHKKGQTPEFWNLQADIVKVFQETEWRTRHPDVVDK